MAHIIKPLMHRNRPTSDADGYPDRDWVGDYKPAFGAYMRQRRIDAGLTQEELGRALGFNYSAISAIELGRNSLAPEHIMPIADVLGVPREEMARQYLRWTLPWVYSILIDPKDRRLLEDLANIPTRAGIDPFRPKSKR